MSLLEIETLLTVPDHLRKTMVAVFTFGVVTANDVAKHTGRARAVESSYLNQLNRMGFFERQKKGRKVYFYKDGFTFVRQQRMAVLMGKLQKLSPELREIFWDDLLGAIHNRLLVLGSVRATDG